MVVHMPSTITLKNIPDAIHLALKRAAVDNHRSLNGEVIARLEKTLQPNVDLAQDHLDRAHLLRQSLGKVQRAKIAKIDIVNIIRADRGRS